MPTHTFRGEIPAPASKVYAFLADVTNLPRYLPLMSGARDLGDGTVEITTEVKGGVHTMAAWFRPDAEYRRIEWGAVDNDGYHGWLVVTGDGLTTSTVEYELTTPRDHTLEPYLRAATTFVTNALTA